MKRTTTTTTITTVANSLSSSFLRIRFVSHVVVVTILMGSCWYSSPVNAFQQPPWLLSTIRTKNNANHYYYHHHHHQALGLSSSTKRSSSSDDDDDDATTPRKERTIMSPAQEEEEEHETTTTTPKRQRKRSSSIVEDCYEAWNQGDMTKAVSYFADNFDYEDSQLGGSIQTRTELQKSFQQRQDLLNAALLGVSSSKPPQVVVDHVAVCTTTGNIGTEYHVEYYDDTTGTYKKVPLTRGCAFYTTTTTSSEEEDANNNKNDFKITSGFRVLEMMIKPPPEFANQLVSSASTLTNLEIPFLSTRPSKTNQASSSSASSRSTTFAAKDDSTTSSSSSSIIEQYFDAWNQRDFETALSYFEEDCVYETEDPVFVGTLRGKDELRSHLVQNAKALPSSCQIILDGIAVDDSSRSDDDDSHGATIGTTWHLEVHGIPLPNLRGCSMYTTHPLTGRLQTGFDVTEAPLKIPKRTLPLVPAKLVGRLVSPLLLLQTKKNNPPK